MTEELQSSEVAVDEPIDTNEAEDLNDGADLAPASEAEHEEQPQANESQDSIQKVINEKVFKAKQAERERDEALARLREFEEQKRQQEAQRYESELVAPDPLLDDNYEEKLAAYVKANAERAAYQERQRIEQERIQTATQAEQQQRQKEVFDSLAAYSAKATQLGIDNNELKAAGDTVSSLGMSQDLQLAIIKDPDGPLITKHLAENPAQALDLINSNPYLAGEKLANIRNAAKKLKPKETRAPAPAERIEAQSGAPADKYKNISGAKIY